MKREAEIMDDDWNNIVRGEGSHLKLNCWVLVVASEPNAISLSA